MLTEDIFEKINLSRLKEYFNNFWLKNTTLEQCEAIVGKPYWFDYGDCRTPDNPVGTYDVEEFDVSFGGTYKFDRLQAARAACIIKELFYGN